MTETEIYSQNQVKNIFPYVDKDVEWFLLGGPADGNEAQVFHEHYPRAKIIGFEPNPVMHNIQTQRGFPGRLLSTALWNTTCEGELHVREDVLQGDRSSGVAGTELHQLRNVLNPARSYKVPCTTLDCLSELYGPFNKAVLWIDIEGAELQCLQGAVELMARKAIRLINLEVFEEDSQKYHEFLKERGFRKVHKWGLQSQERKWWNAVYRLED